MRPQEINPTDRTYSHSEYRTILQHSGAKDSSTSLDYTGPYPHTQRKTIYPTQLRSSDTHDTHDIPRTHSPFPLSNSLDGYAKPYMSQPTLLLDVRPTVTSSKKEELESTRNGRASPAATVRSWTSNLPASTHVNTWTSQSTHPESHQHQLHSRPIQWDPNAKQFTSNPFTPPLPSPSNETRPVFSPEMLLQQEFKPLPDPPESPELSYEKNGSAHALGNYDGRAPEQGKIRPRSKSFGRNAEVQSSRTAVPTATTATSGSQSQSTSPLRTRLRSLSLKRTKSKVKSKALSADASVEDSAGFNTSWMAGGLRTSLKHDDGKGRHLPDQTEVKREALPAASTSSQTASMAKSDSTSTAQAKNPELSHTRVSENQGKLSHNQQETSPMSSVLASPPKLVLLDFG